MNGSKNLLNPDQAERIKISNRRSKEEERNYHKKIIEIFRTNDALIKSANHEYLSDDNETNAKAAQKILRKILREYKTLPEKVRANSKNNNKTYQKDNQELSSSNETTMDELFISLPIFQMSKEIEEHLHIESMNNEMKKIYGTFYGHVIGDAIGVPYEGQKSDVVKERIRIEKLTKDIISITGHPPLVSPGQFTNDTELAITLARSIVAKKGYDKIDVACSYAYLFSVTNPFTVHETMENALICTALTDKKPRSYNLREELNDIEMMKIYNEICKNVEEKNSQCLSNGSLMRISPLAIAFRNESIEKIREIAKEDASITHGNPIVGDAAATYCVAIAALLNGKTKEEAFKTAYNSAETDLIKEFLDDAKNYAIPVKIHLETYPTTTQKTTNGDDHFVAYLGVSFQGAFYELLHASSFSAGMENVILRGGDTDTNACIAGALLGARFGIDELPYEWIKAIKSAPTSLLSYGNVRANLNLEFLSLKDFDGLILQLTNIVNG